MEFIHDRRAVTAVVTVLLIMVVLTTFVTAIRAYYIPSLAAENEIGHMKDVHRSFSELSAKVGSDTSTARVYIPLGDGGLPLYSSLSSSGTITLDPNGSYMNISLYGVNESVIDIYGNTTLYNITNLTGLRMWTDELEAGEYRVSINNSTLNMTSVQVNSNGSLITETFVNNVSLGAMVLKSGSAGDSLLLGNAFGMDLLNPNQTDLNILIGSINQSSFNLTFNGSMAYTLKYEPLSGSLNLSTGYFAYRSSNNYWMDQEMIFENGALILKQGRDAEMRVRPLISLEENNTVLDISLYNITGAEDSLSGNGDVTVNLKVKDGPQYFYHNVSNSTIKIDSRTPDAWYRFFTGLTGDPNSTRIENGSVYSTFYNTTLQISSKEVEIGIP